MCMNGGCSNVCTADGVDLVYVVDEQNDFMSFDPRKLPGNPFTTIGTLNCPHGATSIQNPPGAVMPFSMSVDRDGVAWVLYTSGELFEVSLTTAACTKANNAMVVVGTLTATSNYSPELTGTNEGKLFGFYPNLSTPAYVQEIDKTTGAGTGMKWNLGTAGLGSAIRDWTCAPSVIQ